MSKPLPAIAIDANVLLRYLLDDHEELSEKAAGIWQSVEEDKIVVECDPVILAEVVWVLSSYYKQPSAKIAAALEPVVKSEGFLLPDKARYIRALDLFGHSLKHFGDACACATALEHCNGRLFAFDRKLSRIEGIDRREAATE